MRAAICLALMLAVSPLLAVSPVLAQTPDGASKTEDGDKPTPQATDKDAAEQESVEKAPDQTELPDEGTNPPAASSETEAKDGK